MSVSHIEAVCRLEAAAGVGGQRPPPWDPGTLHPEVFATLCAPKITSVGHNKRKSSEGGVSVKCQNTFLDLITKKPIFMKTRGRITVNSRA